MGPLERSLALAALIASFPTVCRSMSQYVLNQAFGGLLNMQACIVLKAAKNHSIVVGPLVGRFIVISCYHQWTIRSLYMWSCIIHSSPLASGILTSTSHRPLGVMIPVPPSTSLSSTRRKCHRLRASRLFARRRRSSSDVICRMATRMKRRRTI